MTTLFYILGYLAVVGFICLAYLKIKAYMAASPLHVRWELYPVPHEGPKATYGGSFMEEKEWWTKPRHISHWGDIKGILVEVLFLHATLEHNQKLWFRTYPFHVGMYMLMGGTIIVVLSVIAQLCGLDPQGGVMAFVGNVISAVVLLGAGWYLYAAAKRRFAAWDGEDEDAMDAAEQQLSWALLLTGLVIILDFFFFAASIIYDRFLPDLILFLASVAVLVVLQQKIVDLERRINPEKRGSVYDMKFQKTWMDSCDEAERAQIGQACYRAYMVGTKVCIFLWVALLILNFVFDFGLLPIAAVLAVWGAMQTVYALECIRLSKRTGDA